MRVIDFFCGAGGFSEGFRQAGFDIIFAVDKWEAAVNTYKGNKPTVNVVQDDVIRIAELNDEEFEKLVPDSEIIIGSPPCQAFSNSNKSGKADKALGLKLIRAYLRIIARKKFKENSVLKYWILENVPNVRSYIKESYTAEDLGLKGDFVLYTKSPSSTIYNAKNFGAPTNRLRYLCGDFPVPKITHLDNQAVTLGKVLNSLGKPIQEKPTIITDANYPDLQLSYDKLTDHHYILPLARFEWENALRLKRDKGYMGKMSFPENLEKPARTVMATMSASSRESMILSDGNGGYRLPTVREAASMMSFPIDYWFYGKTASTKYTLVGNAVPPKLSFALAKAIMEAEGLTIPASYKRIIHSEELEFLNLNGKKFESKQEKPKRDVAKFKYHIPYLILAAYRVELTNYHSDFENKTFKWTAEIHYSQGKRAAVYKPNLCEIPLEASYIQMANQYIKSIQNKLLSMNEFQEAFCMTMEMRGAKELWGPIELLTHIKEHIAGFLPNENQRTVIQCMFYEANDEMKELKIPLAILYGYYLLAKITEVMEEKSNGCNNTQAKVD